MCVYNLATYLIQVFKSGVNGLNEETTGCGVSMYGTEETNVHVTQEMLH